MADTEVDLLPFLKRRLNLTPEQFTKRCEQSVYELSKRVQEVYGVRQYEGLDLPVAKRFLEYFGFESWYNRYNYFKKKTTAN